MALKQRVANTAKPSATLPNSAYAEVRNELRILLRFRV